MGDRQIDKDTVVALHEYLSTVPSWMYRAQCVADGAQPDSHLPVDRILLSCRTCPVVDMCSQWAQSYDLHSGVYGGKNLLDD